MTAGVRLRVVADDVGQSAAIDDGVASLARAGHLSAASVLVRAPGAPAAMAALDGVIPLGVHVQLEPAELVGASSAQITALITEQVEAMIAAGPSPAHLDLHTAALYGLADGQMAPVDERRASQLSGAELPDDGLSGGRPAPEESASGASTGSVRQGGVLAEAIGVAAAYRLRFRLPRQAPPGLGRAELAAHAQAVAAAQAAGLVLPDVLVTAVPAAGEAPAFLAGLHSLAAGAPGSPPDGSGSPADPSGAPAQHAHVEVELVTHPALRADPHDPLGPERVRQHALLASGALHPW